MKPKPMIEIGHRPILWHIMKLYTAHGLTDFIICCGYKGHIIKEYFANYYLRAADVTFDLKNQSMQIHQNGSEPWSVTCVDTGEETMTGGRLKRARRFFGEETICMTYGDGVGDVNITALVEFHRSQQALATLTAVQPAGRFGAFSLADGETRVPRFAEKPKGDGAWVNGGFFVLEPAALDHVRDDNTVWEREPMEHLAHDGRLSAFRHAGFWQPMDTLRDKMYLEDLWAKGNAPWKVW